VSDSTSPTPASRGGEAIHGRRTFGGDALDAPSGARSPTNCTESPNLITQTPWSRPFDRFLACGYNYPSLRTSPLHPSLERVRGGRYRLCFQSRSITLRVMAETEGSDDDDGGLLSDDAFRRSPLPLAARIAARTGDGIAAAAFFFFPPRMVPCLARSRFVARARARARLYVAHSALTRAAA